MSSEATASTLLIDTTDTSSIVNEPSTPDMQGQTTQNKDVAAVAARQEVPNTTSEQQIAAAGIVTAAGSVTPPSATPAASALKRKDHPSPSSPRSANSVTFADLKAAQRRSMKALREIALTEINSLEPQMPEASRREIAAVLQAHVNEMSSSTFTHLARVYFPTELRTPPCRPSHTSNLIICIESTKKTESPVDPAALARIKDLEAQIHATEQRIHAHQSRLPTTIRDILHANFAAQAKALEVALSSPSKVPVADSDGTSIKYSEEDIAAVKATFARVRRLSIAHPYDLPISHCMTMIDFSQNRPTEYQVTHDDATSYGHHPCGTDV
ncbi:hypothetical protein B5M09_002128 [Aphanomyces astaci]|uniref:Uncharacterized protein n=1 Tax=Aphanomyces astaci TaxID=112090 RepID=A0A3R7WNV6_APHAT|nr:hypothetical protein B5M09_002128 [Aphanomyces astaci]